MTDAMISLGDGCWKFPGAQIETDSWEAECRSDGKMLLHDDTGAVIEGIEVDAPEDADSSSATDALGLSPHKPTRFLGGFNLFLP